MFNPMDLLKSTISNTLPVRRNHNKYKRIYLKGSEKLKYHEKYCKSQHDITDFFNNAHDRMFK